MTHLFPNVKVKNSDIIKIYDQFDNDIFDNIHFKGNSLLNFTIKFRNLDLLKYFVEKKKMVLDMGDHINTMHPFINAYRMAKEEGHGSELINVVKYIWNTIKKDVKWYETDFNGENIAFRLLDIKAEFNETENL